MLETDSTVGLYVHRQREQSQNRDAEVASGLIFIDVICQYGDLSSEDLLPRDSEKVIQLLIDLLLIDLLGCVIQVNF